MIVEIDLESEQRLSDGDCIEVNGVVGSQKWEITFLIGKRPKFICSLDPRYGWDVYVTEKTARHIESGTIFTSLEYYTDSIFTLRLLILSDTIKTTLNERDLAITDKFSAVNEITSIKVSGDSLIKTISFSDFSNKSSRLLQPVIYRSLQSAGNGEDDFVTIIESRQRIVFKLQNDDADNAHFSAYNSDSDLDLSDTEEPHCDFNYIKKLLLSMSTSDTDDFHSKILTPAPPNKYVISYFDPDLIDDSNYESLNYNLKTSLECKAVKMNNEKRAETNSKLTLLKSQTERIQQNLLNSARDIEKNRLTTSVSVDGNYAHKGTKRSSPHLRFTSGRPSSARSKIPIFKKAV